MKESLESYKGKLYPDTENEAHIAINNTNISSLKIDTNIEHTSFISNDPIQAKVLIAMALAFFSGVFQVIVSK